MSGPRYLDWTHTRVLGDNRDAGIPYLQTARKLLGFVVDEAKRNNLGVAQIQRTLPDGTVIIAEKHGDIPRVTIIPPPLDGKPPPPSPPDDFVVWGRDEFSPDGIDLDHPEQILRATPGESGTGSAGGLYVSGNSATTWKTYFFSSDVSNYPSFPGEKATYSGLFVDGIKHHGNVDWRGHNGERVNWYGPSTRYWYDPHIQPRTQYGKFVFLLGQTVLDIEEYITDSEDDDPFAERWVMGAALSGNKLLVMQAELPVATTDDSLPAFNTCDISTPWPVGDVNLLLCSYTVTQEDPVTFRALANSREVLWSGTRANAYSPWFFNESATAAVSLGLPENVLVRRRFGATIGDPHTMDAPLPSDSSQVFTLALDDEGDWGVNDVSVNMVPGGSGVVAADFIRDDLVQMTVRREAKDELTNRFVFELDGLDMPVRDVVFTPITPDPDDGIGSRAAWTGFQSSLLYADLRTNTLVVYRYNVYAVSNMPHLNVYSEQVQVWRDGVMVGTPLNNVPGGFTDPRDTGFARQLGITDNGETKYDAVYAAANLSPLFAIYGHISQFQLLPIWDWTGAHGLYSYRAYPTTEWFGAARLNSTPASGVNRLDDASDAFFESDQLDFDEHYSVLGCATSDDITMLSCYGYEQGTGKSINFVDDTTLATLTGVEAENARYHPIWLLGKQPLAA